MIGDEKFESFAFDGPGHEVAKTTGMCGHCGRPDDIRKPPSAPPLKLFSPQREGLLGGANSNGDSVEEG